MMSESSGNPPSDETIDERDDARDSDLVDDMDAFDESSSFTSRQLQFVLFCVMLLLALGGLALSQALESGAWEYWLFVVLVYAGIGTWKATREAKRKGKPVRDGVIRTLSHWGALIGFMAVLLFLERRQIVDRQSASFFALMLLSLSCFTAGVHLDWQLLLLGIVLTVMVVSIALLEQYEITLWIIMIVVAVLAAVFLHFKTKRRLPAADKPG